MASSSFIMWIGAQLTFIQEFTPSIITDFGGKTASNHSLWTISVELLLYFTIPIIYLIVSKFSKRGYKALIILLIGLLSYVLYNQLGFGKVMSSLIDNEYYKILIHPFNQICAMFFFFSIGIFIYLYKDKIIPFLAGKAIPLLAIYICASVLYYKLGFEPGSYSPNVVELMLHLLLVLCIFSSAYTAPHLANKLLGKTDISYGMYIYHYLIINLFIEIGYEKNNIINFIPCFLLILVVSWLSWTFVESKMMRFKRKSLIKQ